MQYLNVTLDFEEKPRAKPIPKEEYEGRKVYVQYHIEFDFLWTSLKKTVPGSFCVGEL